MWIKFESKEPYAVKIYVGAVNAVSGEPAAETAATRLRRHNLLSRNKSIQDYVVIPDQKWLDGIATSEGKVRQFVAMPIGSGYSVEAQVTGIDITGGLQFEITPAKQPKITLPAQLPDPYSTQYKQAIQPSNELMVLYIKTLTGSTIAMDAVGQSWTVGRLKAMIQQKEGIPINEQRLIFEGRQLAGNNHSVK